MPRHSSATRVQSVTSSALNLIQSAQVEHQGEYSNHRLRSLQDYINNKFTRSRLAALLLITPWPSIAIVILLELAPLNPPSSGADDNIVFWIRFASVMTIMGVCYITMTHIGVPLLNITLLQGILTVAIATAVSMGVVYICSIKIGFPVPFAITIASVPGMMIQWIIMGGLSFRRILANTEAILSLKEWHHVSGLVATQFFVYPFFNYAFRLATPAGQTALSFVPAIMKIVYKYAMGKIIKQQADDKAEIVTFNAEIGHAMFVTFTMQNATSTTTVVVLLMIDILHSSSVIYEAHRMMQRLETLDQAIRIHETKTSQDRSIVDCAVDMISWEQGTACSSLKLNGSRCASEGWKSQPNRYCRQYPGKQTKNTAKIHVEPSTSLKHAAIRDAVLIHSSSTAGVEKCRSISESQLPLGRAESEYIATTLRLLHLTEFTMLGELVEFAVPVIYTAYTIVMIYLPNRIYCSQLSALDSDKMGPTVFKMLAYGLLELLSLVTLDSILKRRLKFSPAAQLAMVLESHWTSVQAGFVIWVVYTVQGLIEHYGADFSFQFAWLHSNSTAAA